MVTPGPPYWTRDDKEVHFAADEADIRVVDTVNYRADLGSDSHGMLFLPVLIPGARYRVIDFSTAGRDGSGVHVRQEFSVKPGETLDLGDILIEKPQSRGRSQ